jgi:hypothetical protein
MQGQGGEIGGKAWIQGQKEVTKQRKWKGHESSFET